MQPHVGAQRRAEVVDNTHGSSVLQGKCHLDATQFVIDSNASLSGWGAVCKNKTVSGWWMESERQEQINFLLLRGILLADQVFVDKPHVHQV